MRTAMRLAGTTVLLTAGAGRCETLVLGLSREGARLIVHGEDEEVAARVARAVRAQGGACEVVARDAASVAGVERMVEDLWGRFAPIGGAVLAPGLDPTGGGTARPVFLESGLGVWHDSLVAGLELPFFLIRALAWRMQEGDGGAIVSIVPSPSPQLDCVARVVRGGLVTMTRGLAKVLPERVRIAAVSGGSGESRTACVGFLLAEASVASGTIVELES